MQYYNSDRKIIESRNVNVIIYNLELKYDLI